MRIFDIINKKKRGGALTKAEIDFTVNGFTQGIIGEGPMAALLMAINLVGFNREETSLLTMAMAASGHIADLSKINMPTVDKHSTGGVGDKLTLIVAPIVAALGVAVPKMSGRSLGHTGGTIDKLESFPGLSAKITHEDFVEQINKIGICIAEQSESLAPADKKIYALRDTTATVDSIPLIAASIMSKKIAAGASAILLDVKAGSGAFMKTPEEAVKLADIMVEIGRDCKKDMAAVVTAMDEPLGRCVGDAIEVFEAVEVLKNQEKGDLTALSTELAAHMLALGKKDSVAECRKLAESAIKSGEALRKFLEMIRHQGGDAGYILNPNLISESNHYEVIAPHTGYISSINGEICGNAAHMLSASRNTLSGLILREKTGSYVNKGDSLALLYCPDYDRFDSAEKVLLSAYEFSDEKPTKKPLIYHTII